MKPFIFFIALLTNLLTNSFASEKSHQLNGWCGNKNFWFSLDNDIVKVEVNKKGFETFSVKLDNINLLENQILTLDIMSYDNISLMFQITDGNHFSDFNELNVNIIGDITFQIINLDLGNLVSLFDVNLDKYLIISLNPGKDFKGVIFFKDLNKRESVPAYKDEQYLFPNPAIDSINIQVTAPIYTALDIYDINGIQVMNRAITPMISVIKLDISMINSGTYVLMLSGTKTNWVSHFVVF